MKKINTYTKLKIEGNFNVEKFSEEFKMSPLDLVAFHNKHCEIHELLSVSLPKYIEYLYLPTDAFIERDRQLLKSSSLHLPSIHSHKKYGVVFLFSPKKLQIQYEVNVKRKANFLEITKEKTFVNNQVVNKLIEQLFENAEQTLYPIQILQRQNGEVEKIENHGEIFQRWKQSGLPRLKKYFQSEITDEIINKFNKIFENIDDKRNLITQNLFLIYLFPLLFINTTLSFQNKEL